MNNQRDAILGYADEQHAYFIQLIENNTILGNSYGLICNNPHSDDADSIMTTLFLKKSFWLNGSAFTDVIKGLEAI